MQQKDIEFGKFLSNFDWTLLKAQAHKWDDAVKKTYLHQIIFLKLTERMIVVSEEPTYNGYCQQLREIADRLASYKARPDARQWDVPRGDRKPYIKEPAPSQASAPPAPREPHAMDWQSITGRAGQRAKWVSEAEIAWQQSNNLCLRCKASSHMINHCFYQPARRPSPARASPKVNHAIEPLLEAECDSDAETMTSSQRKE